MRETQKSVMALEGGKAKPRRPSYLGRRLIRISRARASVWLWDYNQRPLDNGDCILLFIHSRLFAGRPLCSCTGTYLVYLTHSTIYKFQSSVSCKKKKKRKTISPADEFRKQFQKVLYICDLLFFFQPKPQNWNKRHKLHQVKWAKISKQQKWCQLPRATNGWWME